MIVVVVHFGAQHQQYAGDKEAESQFAKKAVLELDRVYASAK